jgi:DNA-binding transcriptional regulator GbsR (MarR family)
MQTEDTAAAAEEAKKEHIEKVGVFFEKSGFPRMVGRVLGFLLIAEPPYKTFNEIQEYLQASKSSISTSLQFLLNQGLVGYFTLPGDRKRYFRLNAETWLEMVRKELCHFGVVSKMMRDCVKLRSKEHEKFNQALADIADFYAFFEQESLQLLDRYVRDQGKK